MKLLDTDVCIEILRGNARVIERRRRTPDEVATTWITACELAYGAAKSRAPEPNRALVMAFLATLPILELDWAAAERFGRLKADLERAGNRVADADLLIAVFTINRSAVLATDNEKDFDGLNVTVENWTKDN